MTYLTVATIIVSGLLQLFRKVHYGAYQRQLAYIRAIVKHSLIAYGTQRYDHCVLGY